MWLDGVIRMLHVTVVLLFGILYPSELVMTLEYQVKKDCNNSNNAVNDQNNKKNYQVNCFILDGI